MKDNTLVSVIVPVYNASKRLHLAINSLINQSYNSLEIICVNDGSKDNSLEILNEFAKQDERIIVIDTPNQGGALARQEGLDIAKGEYLYFPDSDDEVDVDAIKKLLESAKQHNSDIVVGNYKEVDENGRTIRHNSNPASFKLDEDINYTTFKDLVTLKPALWNKLFRTSFIKNNDIKFIDSSIAQDSGFTYQALFFKPSVTYINHSVYNYAILDNSISRTYKLSIVDVIIVFDQLRQKLSKQSSENDDIIAFDYIVLTHMIFHITKVPLLNESSDRLSVYNDFMNYITTNNLISNRIYKKSLVYRFIFLVQSMKSVYLSKYFIRMYTWFYRSNLVHKISRLLD